MFGRRTGIRADWRRVFAEAAATGKALEIDANARRQDLDLASVELAVAEGVRWFSIGSDAHDAGELDFLPIGLAIARAAGVPRERILNYRSAEQVIAWAAALRDAG
jgi:histidinol phosphatase-like PHP family hydrolase